LLPGALSGGEERDFGSLTRSRYKSYKHYIVTMALLTL